MTPTPVTGAGQAGCLRLVAVMLTDQKTQVDQLTAQLAGLTRRRETILLLRRNLMRLQPWQFRRRARFLFQLAELAVTLAEESAPRDLRDDVKSRGRSTDYRLAGP